MSIIIDNKTYRNLEEQVLKNKEDIEDLQGGSPRSIDYTNLTNKPSINSVELVGNKSLSNLGIQEKLTSGSTIKTINNQSVLGSGNISIPKGDKGDTGARGPRGYQGEQGPQGPKGDTGETGPAGRDGTNGQDGTNGRDGVIQYTAGTGISIADNTISCTVSPGATYTAGTGIDITNNEISVTNPVPDGTGYAGAFLKEGSSGPVWAEPVTGTNDGTNWTSLSVQTTTGLLTYNIPASSGPAPKLYRHSISTTYSVDYQIHIIIYSNSPTAFTKATLATWLYNNNNRSFSSAYKTVSSLFADTYWVMYDRVFCTDGRTLYAAGWKIDDEGHGSWNTQLYNNLSDTVLEIF